MTEEVLGAAEAAIGFPQLNAATYPGQMFWLLIAFVVLYALMSKLSLPRVAEVLDRRAKQRTDNLDRAEQLQEEAGRARESYEATLAKAQQTAQESLQSAEREISDKISDENAKFMENARKRVLDAERNIAKAKEGALASVADIAAEIAADMAGKIADVQVSKADAKIIAQSVMQKG